MSDNLTQSIRTSHAHSVAHIVTYTLTLSPSYPLHHGTLRLSYPYLYTYPTVHLRNTPTLPIRYLYVFYTSYMYAYRYALSDSLCTSYTLPVVYLLLSYILYDNIDCCEQGRKPALAIFYKS